MIGSDILVFPDTGLDFLKTVRMAALYSKQIHVLTVVDRRLFAGLHEEIDRIHKSVDKDLEPSFLYLMRRIGDYLRFMKGADPDLSVLEKERILLPLNIESLDFLSLKNDLPELLKTEKIEPSIQALDAQILEVLRSFPPCLTDILLLAALVFMLKGEGEFEDAYAKVKALEDSIEGEHLLTGLALAVALAYLLILSFIAEKRGIGLCSWSSEYQNALWTCRQMLPITSKQKAPELERRDFTEMRLGQTVLERHLPSAEDLPIEDLLKIREARESELEAFRISLRELASRIDVTQETNDLELQVRDLVASHVDPALRDLRAALNSSRLDILKKISRPWEGLPASVIPATIAYAAGAPLDLSAVVALIGKIAIGLIEGSIERKQILRGSQWSILLQFEKLTSKKRRIT